MQKRVVIIGAGGASGLAVHRELVQKQFHSRLKIVAALEAGSEIGG